MVVRIGTCMMLIAVVYSAVIVGTMKIVIKVDETIYQRQAKPDQHVEIYFIFLANIGIIVVDMLIYWLKITICT